MKEPTREKVVEVASAIERYLDNRPMAADTLDGVTNWWIPKRYDNSRDVVQDALDYLVEQRKVEIVIQRGRQKLYKRCS